MLWLHEINHDGFRVCSAPRARWAFEDIVPKRKTSRANAAARADWLKSKNWRAWRCGARRRTGDDEHSRRVAHA